MQLKKSQNPTPELDELVKQKFDPLIIQRPRFLDLSHQQTLPSEVLNSTK